MEKVPSESDLYVPRKATSEVWKAFRLSYTEPNKAYCSVCQLWLTWKRTTSNLLLHCKSWHRSDEDGRLTRRQKTPSSGSNSVTPTPSPSPPPLPLESLDPVSSPVPVPPQPAPVGTLASAHDYLTGLNLSLDPGADGDIFSSLPADPVAMDVDSPEKPPGGDPKDDRVARDAAIMLVVDVLPSAVLEGPGFLSFTRSLRNDFSAPTRRALLAQLDAMFSEQASQVAEALSRSDCFSLAVDVWEPSHGNRCFATVTAHCPTCPALTLHVHYNDTSAFPPQASVEDVIVANAVSETMGAWKIDPSRVVSITSPSDLSSRHFPHVQTHVTCFAHVLQRAMRQAIARHEEMIARVIALVGGTGGPPQALPKSWLAVCRVMRVCTKADPEKFEAARDDIASVISLWNLLRPARKAVEKLAEDTVFLSVSAARAQLELILDAATKVSIGREVDHAVRGTAFHVAQTISDALSTWKAEDRAESLALSCVLDPTKKYISPGNGPQNGVDEAVELLKRCLDGDKVEGEDGGGELEAEAREYLSSPLAPQNTSSQVWWKLNEDRFPLLATAAQTVLFIPATAASPKQALAAESDLVRRRQRLANDLEVSPAYVQTIMFLNCNRTL